MKKRLSRDANKFVFGIVKISGYIFYTFQRVGNEIYFKKKVTDYILFALSVILSVQAFMNLQSQNFNGDIRSQILSLGLNFSRRSFAMSIIYTKFYNFFVQLRSFEIIQALYWIEKKVF